MTLSVLVFIVALLQMLNFWMARAINLQMGVLILGLQKGLVPKGFTREEQ